MFARIPTRIPWRVAARTLLAASVSSAILAAAPARGAGARDAFLLQEMFQSENPERQREICIEILSEKPDEFARAFCEGYERLHAGLDREAARWLDQAVIERPDFAVGAMLYGEAYERLGKLDLAESYYRRAVELQPERNDSRFALGSLLVLRGQEDPAHLPPALEVFRQMTERNPASPDGWSNMGMVLTLMGRYADAESVYRRAIDRAPDNPFLHTSLGAVYAREDRFEEAEAAWRKALQLNPGYGHAVVELAALYAREGDLARAIETLESARRAVQAPPWGPRVRRNLGFAYLGMDENARAAERFREATRTGEDALAYFGLGHGWMLAGETRNALAAFERGAALDSVLALPFLRAWKATLKFAADSLAHSHVRRAIARLDGGAVAPDERPALLQTTGPAATPALVDFVLDGWSFEDADLVRARIDAAAADTAGTGYDTPPVPVTQIQPEIPPSLAGGDIQGTVQVLVTVDENGNVVDARIASCAAPIALCESAQKAARGWEFRPATRLGAPVRASIVLPFRFSRER